MKTYPRRTTAIAAALLASSLNALAAGTDESSSVPAMAQAQLETAQAAAKMALDTIGLELSGYMRSGFYYAKDNLAKGHYGLGQLGFNRLGNEGDTYLEFGFGKKWKIDGAKLGTYWMPYLYNADCCNGSGTKQVYTDISGLSIAPELSFWAGQRYHRIQDVHIIDQWLMEDGDNFGAGVDGFKVGGGSLNIAVHTEGNTDDSRNTSNAKRLNFQLKELPITEGGTLNLTGAIVRGDFADKTTSGALGLLYNQKIGVLTNSLFVQGSNGHAALTGKFYALNGQTETTTLSFFCKVAENPDGSCPTAQTGANSVTTRTATANSGAKQFRLVDAINWQSGRFGGQALVGYQTLTPEDTQVKQTNFAVGARLSYGIMKNLKLYGDANFATLKQDNAATQEINKGTIALALAPNTDFWTRPEIRLYLTRVGGNDALKASGAFGTRSSAILAGLQVEAWW